MAKKYLIGEPVAFGFYSAQLHLLKPSSTYAFSQLRFGSTSGLWLGRSRTINILWRGNGAQAALDDVHQLHPDALYKGIVTSKNFLVPLGYHALRVVGPPIDLENFSFGAIQRVAPPNASARSNVLKLVVSNANAAAMKDLS